MPAPTNSDELLQLVRKSGLVEEKKLDAYLERVRTGGDLPADTSKFAGNLVRDGILTQFQAEQLLLGKWRRFHIGKYKVLERIGSGGMGSVYLCEHRLMRRRVAVKVLPTAKADDSSAKERFLREARAVAALDHPNIVRAYDIDQDDNLHFLVMEYVDGCNLQEIVKRTGPLDVHRCAHYMAQAALALQHAHEVAGIVHRDIKPGNILVDRNGVVKVLDMGLARFFHDKEDLLTQKYDENVLGTADYLAPEQALDSHSVDIRADIYSLGATLYFCLTAKAPFSEGTVAQKLIWHQTRQPKPIRSQRPEVPEELAALAERMMAKDPAQRFQTPIEVAQALYLWTQTPIAPPSAAEMPKLSPAAMGSALVPTEGNAVDMFPSVQATGPGSRTRKVWQVPGGPSSQPPQPPSTPSGPPKAALAASSPSGAAALAPPPAPAVESAQAIPASNPEPVSWEALAAETKEALLQSDTEPNRPRKPRAVPSTSPPATAWTVSRPVLLGGAAAAMLLLGGLVYLLVRVLSGEGNKSGALSQAAPAFLRVERAAHGQPGTYGTLREALSRARNQERIKVVDEAIEEQIELADPRFARDVQIESAVEGRPFVWRMPAQARDSGPLLKVNGIEGLRIRDFILDGLGKASDLVTVQGICPGFTLEAGQLKGFTSRGLMLVNCEGRADKPVRLRRLEIHRKSPREIGLYFDAHARVREGANLHIQVESCTVVGGTGPGIQLASQEVIRQVQFLDTPKPEVNASKVPPLK